MKKFDLFELKQRLEKDRVRNTEHTTGQRILSAIVYAVACLMFASLFSTFSIPDPAKYALYGALAVAWVLMCFHFGVFKRK